MRSRPRRMKRFIDPYGEFAFKYNAAYCCCDTEEEIQLPTGMGTGTFKRYFLGDGLEITICDLQLERELSIDFMAATREVIDMCCCLSGSYHYEFERRKTEQVALSSGDYHVRRYGGMPYSMKFPTGERIVFLEVRMDASRIQPCSDRKEDRRNYCVEDFLASCRPYFASGSLPLEQICSLEEMLACTYSGYAKQLFIEGRALEWIAYCVNRHFCEDRGFQQAVRLETAVASSM